MITALLNKLPAVRRLRADLTAAQAQIETQDKQIATERGQINARLHAEAELRDNLTECKRKRAELQRQFDDLRELTVRQAASVEILTKDRERNERRIQELTLQNGEARQREERFMGTLTTLNENLRERLVEIADLNAALADVRAELARGRRPVLFARTAGMSDEDRHRALAGRGDSEQIKALLDLLDECATAAMSENASRPACPVNDGKAFLPGFTERDREFTSGGVFALVELKRRALELIAPHIEERKAA